MIKHFAANTVGRDFVVGDIHGCFRKLEAELANLGFDPDLDRLFSVGDLVDRGPDSELVIEWLGKPWFHPVRGNHEQMAVDFVYRQLDTQCYIANGGAWFLALTGPGQVQIADAFSALPVAIEVETSAGLVGIVHADCPHPSWSDMAAALCGPRRDMVAEVCMWSRERITSGDSSGVADAFAVFVGHTPVKAAHRLANVHYIDTGAVFGRALTIIQIN
jgi:serine/threonine protein phosphatase 1